MNANSRTRQGEDASERCRLCRHQCEIDARQIAARTRALRSRAPGRCRPLGVGSLWLGPGRRRVTSRTASDGLISLELCHGTGAQCRSERSRTPCQAIDFSGEMVRWRREGDPHHFCQFCSDHRTHLDTPVRPFSADKRTWPPGAGLTEKCQTLTLRHSLR